MMASLRPERVDFGDAWSRLRATVESVVVLSRVQRREWNDRFSDVYKLCVAFPEPLGDKLYNETKSFLDVHVKNLYKKVVLIESESESNDAALLSAYHSHWLVYREGVNYLNKLYMYLNTQHVKKHKFSEADMNYGCIDSFEQMLEIGELGLYLWKKNMIEPLRDKLVYLLLQSIENDRLGRAANESVVQGVILSLVHVDEYKKKGALDLYQEMFEKPFLDATGEYYRCEAERLLQNSDCAEYMERVLMRLDCENVRSRKYLHASSFPRVTSECEARMVADHITFLHSECKSMVVGDKRKDLLNMYKLLKPIDSGLHVLIKEVQEHITRIGLGVVSNLTGDNIPQCFVENVLDVHKKHLNMLQDVFKGDQQFIGALDKACSIIINSRPNPKQVCKSPELLARYCDSLLKKSAKGMNESEIEDKLGQSITVFKYIEDKDVFQKFYAKMLAKRLIHAQSVSMDSEEGMINKLKQACGYEFTSKLHRMFTDVKVSDDLNNNFSAWLKSNNLDVGVNFSIYVLQAGAWPLGQSLVSSFAIPQPLEKSVAQFENFYKSKFSGRKLTWLHHLSTAELRLGFTRKSYLVSMSTYHMAILLLFESSNSLTYKEIQDSTKLTDEQLAKHMQSLIDVKLIYSNPMNNNEISMSSATATNYSLNDQAQLDMALSTMSAASSMTSVASVNSEAVYNLNTSYSNKRMKFKITAILQREQQQQQEVEQTHVSVDEDRKLYLQAAIVRIMKARKAIKHTQLLQEVINQAKNRFTPNVAMIKKCIESLIDKQYLERATSSTDEYSYVA